jgi:hypothetical protein
VTVSITVLRSVFPANKQKTANKTCGAFVRHRATHLVAYRPVLMLLSA